MPGPISLVPAISEALASLQTPLCRQCTTGLAQDADPYQRCLTCILAEVDPVVTLADAEWERDEYEPGPAA